MLYGLGFMLLILGITTADSDSLVVPFVLVMAGAVLVYIAKRKEANDETD